MPAFRAPHNAASSFAIRFRQFRRFTTLHRNIRYFNYSHNSFDNASSRELGFAFISADILFHISWDFASIPGSPAWAWGLGHAAFARRAGPRRPAPRHRAPPPGRAHAFASFVVAITHVGITFTDNHQHRFRGVPPHHIPASAFRKCFRFGFVYPPHYHEFNHCFQFHSSVQSNH